MSPSLLESTTVQSVEASTPTGTDSTHFSYKNEEEIEYTFTLGPEIEEFARKELGETPEVRQSQLTALRHYVRSKPHLHQSRTDANFLLRFLRCQKFNFEKSCKLLEKYHETRCAHPDWLTSLDPTAPSMVQLVEDGHFFVLRDRDSSGRRVIINDVTRMDLDAGFENKDVMRLIIATIEVLLNDEENQIKGFTYIFHCKNMTLAHCAIWSPSDASRAFGICEKNLPARHSDINLVHLSLAAWAVLEFVKQFLSAKIKGRLVSIDNNNKLVDKFGKNILPKEYGGDASTSISDMASTWLKELQESKSYLLSLDNMISERRYEDVAETNKKVEKIKKVSGIWSYIPGLR